MLIMNRKISKRRQTKWNAWTADCFLSISFLAYYICFAEQKTQVNQKKIKFWVSPLAVSSLTITTKNDTLPVILYHGLMSRTIFFNMFVFDQIFVIIRKFDTGLILLSTQEVKASQPWKIKSYDWRDITQLFTPHNTVTSHEIH